MFNIIKSDLYRIMKGKAIYIVMLLIMVMSITSVVMLSAGHVGLSVGQSNIDMNDNEFVEALSKANTLKEVREIMKSGGEFPLDKDIVGQNVNLYYLFIVVVVIVVATDFSNKSIKNTLSSAVSKKTYYFSKLFLILGLGTFLIFFNNYFSYFLNRVVNGKQFSTSLLDFTISTFFQLPLLYGIMSLLVCFAFVLKKTSVFNTVSIPFIMAVQLVIMGVANLLRWKIDWFYDYEIQFALSNLMKNPSNPYIITCLFLGIVYIVVFNGIGYYSFRHSEIK